MLGSLVGASGDDSDLRHSGSERDGMLMAVNTHSQSNMDARCLRSVSREDLMCLERALF